MTVTLAAVRREASAELYPRHVLTGCESALVLFAAAWHGKQDAVWMAEAGLTATCVDVDGDRLSEMEAAYPSGWEFVAADAFDYATAAERQWDVVSLDPFTNLIDRCAGMLPLWCLLARKAVVLGCCEATDVLAPTGWRVTEMLHRSTFVGGVFWAVLERDE